MQVVGNPRIEEAAANIAARADSPEIRDWALRVIPRHIRRTRQLLDKVSDHKALARLMKEDGLPAHAAQRIMVGFKAGEDVFTPSRAVGTEFLRRAVDTLDWLRSLPSNDRRLRRIERMSWLDAEENSRAWHASLARARMTAGDLMRDARKIADFEGGAFLVELESQKALKAEGAAMGHCVGGYWPRVESGQTRIVSLRDDKGHPHVTVELGRPPRVDVVGRGEVAVARMPPNGVSALLETHQDWRAVQVRGKCNEVPVKRWLDPVTDWLEANGIAWSENFGGYAVDLVGPTVYTVNGTPYLDPVSAAHAGEIEVLSDLKRRKSFSTYAASGLQGIHAAIRETSPAIIDGFLGKALPICTDLMWGRMRAGSSMVVAILESGIGRIMGILSERSDGNDARMQILGQLLDCGPQQAKQSNVTLIEEPGGPGIDVIVHEVPLAALSLLSSGLAVGAEDMALDRLRPHLSAVIEHARRRPDAIHAITSIEGAIIAEEDIHRGILASGLAAAHAQAVAAVDAGVRSRRREVALRLKQARMSGRVDMETANRSSNALSDGFEDRFARLVQETLRKRPFMIRPLQASPTNARAREAAPAATPIKRYAMPAAPTIRRVEAPMRIR